MKRSRRQEREKRTEGGGYEKTFTVEERIAPKRVVSLLVYILVTVAFLLINTWRSSLSTGAFVCESLIVVPACLCIVLLLVHERRAKRLWYEDTDYLLFVVLTTVSFGIMTGISFAPLGLLLPTGIAAFICASSGNVSLTVCQALLMVVTVTFGGGFDGSTYGMFFCEAIVAAAASDLIIRSRRMERTLIGIALTAVYTALPVSITYFEKLELQGRDILLSALMAAITAIVGTCVMPLLYTRLHREKDYRYDTILDDSYSLIKEIRLFSEAEYRRAEKLSRVSLIAAREIGADAALAAAGGLYYRVGLLRGDNEIEYAIQIAAEHGFPESLISILYEYQGLIRKPASKESAIVHMSDAVMRRLDAISRQGELMESGWNRQMLIYSVLNELSTSGSYDESTITMNQFLTLRDVLVKEL